MGARGIAQGMMLAALILILSRPAGHAEEATVYPNVSTEKLEGILKSLDVKYKKNPGKKEGTYFYHFERESKPVMLHHYNGKELWIDIQVEDKGDLDTVNNWNRRAKFSRALLLKNNDKTTITLESQLDCRGGVTEGMIRQFLQRFDGEIRDFGKYLEKQ